MTITLTDEQQQVINHPDGCHARVLSVAGSGKTTTMAHRIKHLMAERNVERHQIQVLMFNAAARAQFKQKLEEIGILPEHQPPVDTFHSYAYRFINVQGFKPWFGNTDELHHLHVKQAVDRVRADFARRDASFDEEKLDVAAAERAIDLWKGSLVRPSDAGYTGPLSDAYVAVYREYERDRIKANAITFSDFVPMAIQRLPSRQTGSHPGSELKHIIVDEYQDVNLGQQRLVEILAGGDADVMVVGDDDQTIYEWRGARSDYILGEFTATFDNKPHTTYKLTNTFRFGYLLAQTSYNVITHNANRETKDLLSSDPSQDSEVSVITDTAVAGDYANRALVDEMVSLVSDKGVLPRDIRVLGRTHAQLTELQGELLIRKVPFIVQGRVSFLQTGESQALLDYLRVAARLYDVPDTGTVAKFINIANKPSRYLRREGLRKAIDVGRGADQPMLTILKGLAGSPDAFLSSRQRQSLNELTAFLESLGTRLTASEMGDGQRKAGPILRWVDESVGYCDHYLDYFGDGEESRTRIETVSTLMRYAELLDIDWQEFIAHSENADTTLGFAEDKCITMMTIHTSKGLEFDYVFIPNCEEGHMPVIASNDDPTFNKSEPKRTLRAAEWIESERRLFYVGATRAKRALFIGAPHLQTTSASEARNSSPSEEVDRKHKSSRFLEEMELEPSREVATEVVKAAHKQSNRLAEVLRKHSPHRAILNNVKKTLNLGRNLFSRSDRNQVAAVEPDGAERPFTYKQVYESPLKQIPEESKPSGEIWPHINLNRPQRDSTPRRTVLPPKRTI